MKISFGTVFCVLILLTNASPQNPKKICGEIKKFVESRKQSDLEIRADSITKSGCKFELYNSNGETYFAFSVKKWPSKSKAEMISRNEIRTVPRQFLPVFIPVNSNGRWSELKYWQRNRMLDFGLFYLRKGRVTVFALTSANQDTERLSEILGVDLGTK